MPAVTSANVANAIVKLVAVDALPALMGNLVMGNLVNRDFEPTLGQAGDTVNVPIPPVLVANNLAEGGTVQAQNPDLGNAQIVLNTHAEATFQIPDVTKVLAVPDLLRLYMQPAVVALAEKIESDLLSTYASFTTAGEAGLRALVDGTVGKIKDFFVFRSQFVQKTGSAPVTTNNLGFARSALGLVMRRLPQPLPGTGAIAEYAELGNFGLRVVMSYQPNTLAQQFTVDVLYGVGVLRNSFGIQVRS